MQRIPSGVVVLGLVSLFMDMSSEMIHALLPIYLTTSLGASALMVGLVEGVGQAVAQVSKLGSGLLTDLSGRRKPLALLGYGLSALTRPVFALAPSVGWILAARVTDRLGKGIRGTPRDAMVADMVEPANRAAAYGLRQSLDSLGAFGGPLIAIALLAAGLSIPAVFAWAVVPALVSVALLAFVLREPAARQGARPVARIDRAALARLGPGVWAAIVLGGLMTLARISDAFLILRVADQGVPLLWLPLVLVLLNAVDTATSWPVGALADRIGKRGLLRLGFGVLVLANLALMLPGLPMAFVGVALWGLHMGLTQGLITATVADAAPSDLRGTAFGMFNLATGLAVLVGNGLAGVVAAGWGLEAMFAMAAGLALVPLVWSVLR